MLDFGLAKLTADTFSRIGDGVSLTLSRSMIEA